MPGFPVKSLLMPCAFQYAAGRTSRTVVCVSEGLDPVLLPLSHERPQPVGLDRTSPDLRI